MKPIACLSALGLGVVLFSACGAPPSGEDVAHTGSAVSAGQIFNFGAIAHSGSCMDAQASGTVDGTQIQEWQCNGTGAQSYELGDAGDGAFFIVNTNSGKCVDVNARGTANGTKIQLWDCNGTSAQSYSVQDAGDGYVSFVNTNSGKCLDVSADDPNNGTVVQLYDCNGTNAQRWNPTVIGSAPAPTPTPAPSPTPTPTPTPTPDPNGTRTFTFVNQCSYDVWVGGEGNPVAPETFCSQGCPSGSTCNTANNLCTYDVPNASTWQLGQGQSTAVTLPPAWGGRFWPRTGCTANGSGLDCATGDCGGNLACPVGVGGAPPATLAEFTVTPPSGGSDFYDVSDVDGSNVPLSIVPASGTYESSPPAGTNAQYYCGSPGSPTGTNGLPGCPWNIEASCPAELQDNDPGHYVGCRSANQVCAVDPSNGTLNCGGEDDLYGCTPGGPNGVSGSCYSAGANASCCGCPSWSPSGACQSSNSRWTGGLAGHYATVIKDWCPTAYSFPYDDPTSTFTCRGSGSSNASYTITFCP